jgi:putative ABC transport system substrate-binding protein
MAAFELSKRQNIMDKNLIHQRWKALMGIIILGLALAACGSGQKTYTVGVVNVLPVLDGTVQGFKEGMAELGYIEGKNVAYIHEEAILRDELDAVLQEMVEAEVDLILSVTTPAAQAAQRATEETDIPIVFVPVTDPVGAGLVDSLKQPGGNITGITFGIQESRRLEWLVQIVPTIKEIYVPYNPNDPAPVAALKTVSEVAPQLGVELITREVRNPEEVETAIKNIPEEADAIFLLPDSLIGSRTTDLVDVALERRLPTSGASADAVNQGNTLTSFGPTESSSGKQAARLAAQILRGVKPADLPVETAEFYLAINLKTAEAIGLDISDEVLLQADIIVR